MKKWKYLVGILILVGAVILCQKTGDYLLSTIETQADAKKNVEKRTVLIDAGHGAADPGKVGINHVLEKDVNLIIAKQLKTLLEEQGIEVVMTRTDDTVLADSKGEDLKKRVELINENEPDLAVSIHQNSYTSSEVKGAQVFYHRDSEGGKAAAEILQEALREIDTENHRQAKADVSYYLLNHTEIPLVIVECGFLSNPEEAEKLNTEEYQKKIAEAICSGLIKYLQR